MGNDIKLDDKAKRNYNAYIYIISLNNNLQKTRFQNNSLVGQNDTIDLSDFPLDEWLKENENNIKSLSNNDFVESVKLKKESEKKNLDKTNIEQALEVIEGVNPKLNNLSIVKLDDGSGVFKEYVHFFDDNGRDYVLYRYAPNDIMEIYNSLIAKVGANNIDAKTLFQELESKMKVVNLQDSESIKNDNSFNENYLKRLGVVEIKNQNSKKLPLGGELFDAENSTGFIVDNKEVKVTENFNGTVEYKTAEETTVIDPNSVNLINDTGYISLTEFILLVTNEEELDSTKEEAIDNYFNHIADLISREDSLSYNEKNELDSYYRFIESLAISETKNNRSQKIYDRHCKLVENNNTKAKALDNQMALRLRCPQNHRTGKVGPYIIVILVILIGIVISFLLIK